MLLLFMGAVASQRIFLYGFQKSEEATISIEFFDPGWKRNRSGSQTIKIISPKNPMTTQLPVMILLPGLTEHKEQYNFLVKEWVQNQYMVVISNSWGGEYEIYWGLNATLDYLFTRSDVNTSQIVIMGHSLGASEAYHFARMRNDSIQAVIASNFGNFNGFYYWGFDYYERIAQFQNESDYENIHNNYSLPIVANCPRNLLLIKDTTDIRDYMAPELMLQNLTAGGASSLNTLYGDFHNGTAREFFISSSIFKHGSSLYSPTVIQKQIAWANQALNRSHITPSKGRIVIDLLIGVFFLALIIVSGYKTAGKLNSTIPRQEKYLRNRFINPENAKDASQKGLSSLITSESIETSELKAVSLENIPLNPPNSSFSTSEKKKIVKCVVFGIVIVEGVLILGNLVVGLLASTRSYLFMSNVFQILGWSSWGVKTLINNNVPFHFMYYWVLSLFTIRKLLRKHTRMRGHHFASYTGRDWAISGLLGVEIFIPIWIIFQFACAGWLGQYFSTIISFNNVILAFYVLYSLNEIVFWIYQNFLRTHPKKEILVI